MASLNFFFPLPLPLPSLFTLLTNNFFYRKLHFGQFKDSPVPMPTDVKIKRKMKFLYKFLLSLPTYLPPFFFKVNTLESVS